MKNDIIKFKLLVEALGVPDKIYETSNLIYNDLLIKLSKIDNIKYLDNQLELKIFNEYMFGEFKFNYVQFTFRYKKISGLNDLNIYNITANNLGRAGDKFRINYLSLPPNISFDLSGPKSRIKIKDIYDYIVNNKIRIISDLAHELSHIYEKFMMTKNNGGTKISNYSEYRSYIETYTGIKPLDEMLFFLYFSNKIEKITRPSEVYSDLKLKNVTKSNFRKEIGNNNIYQTLIRMSNFNYDNMKNSIKINYTKNVDSYFYDTDNLSIDEKINIIILNLYNELANKSINTIMSQVANSNFNVDNILAFKKQQDKYNKMSTQVDTYFRKKQNQINQSAKETLKKIYKIYDMLPDNSDTTSDNSITNLEEWENYHKIKNTPKIKLK